MKVGFVLYAVDTFSNRLIQNATVKQVGITTEVEEFAETLILFFVF